MRKGSKKDLKKKVGKMGKKIDERREKVIKELEEMRRSWKKEDD